MKKIMYDLGEPYWSSVELISMHSVSKGLLGECGLRGGYAECINFSKRAKEMMYKLKSINLCSNTIGQIATGLMCDEPIRGRESDACLDLYEAQKGHVKQGLVKRAKLLEETFNDMDNISCQEIEGAMYAFPRVHFSDKFIAHAKEQKQAPDFIYCMEMLEKTGIMTVPGSGFGQKPDTYHFRITNLMTPTSTMEHALEQLKQFNKEFHQRW